MGAVGRQVQLKWPANLQPVLSPTGPSAPELHLLSPESRPHSKECPMEELSQPDGGSVFSLRHSALTFRPQGETRGNPDVLCGAQFSNECLSKLMVRDKARERVTPEPVAYCSVPLRPWGGCQTPTVPQPTDQMAKK